MTDAFVIDAADRTAGIVVLEARGVRFYASEPVFYPLDGQRFKSLQAARQAITRFPHETQKSKRFGHAARG